MPGPASLPAPLVSGSTGAPELGDPDGTGPDVGGVVPGLVGGLVGGVVGCVVGGTVVAGPLGVEVVGPPVLGLGVFEGVCGLVVDGEVVPGLEVEPCELEGLAVGLADLLADAFASLSALASAAANPGMVKNVELELIACGVLMMVPTEGLSALIIWPLPK